ncbi:MAG TPA: hypothetical protein ENN39_09700 [Desulfonatronum sp.]|nr:hypothetical protein [Desulfonatronum sp.]
MRRFWETFSRALVFNLYACLAYGLSLVLLAIVLPLDTNAFMFSESGPFEIASAVLWFVLALVVLFGVRPRGLTTFSLAALAIIAGLRELGLNKSVTHVSITKLSFYVEQDIFWLERLLVLLLMLGILAVALHLLLRFGRWFFYSGGHAQPAGQVTMLGVILVPATKIMDRLPAYLEGFFGLTLSVGATTICTALEEGFELLLPVFFFQAVFLLPKATRSHSSHTMMFNRVI